MGEPLSPLYAARMVALDRTLVEVAEQQELANAAALLMSSGVIDLDEYERVLIDSGGPTHARSMQERAQLRLFNRTEDVAKEVQHEQRRLHARVLEQRRAQPLGAPVASGRMSSDVEARAHAATLQLLRSAHSAREIDAVLFPVDVRLPFDAMLHGASPVAERWREVSMTRPQAAWPASAGPGSPTRRHYGEESSSGPLPIDDFLARRVVALRIEQDADAERERRAQRERQFAADRETRERAALHAAPTPQIRATLRHQQELARLRQRVSDQTRLPTSPQNLLVGESTSLPPRHRDVVTPRVRIHRGGSGSNGRPSLFDDEALMRRFLVDYE